MFDFRRVPMFALVSLAILAVSCSGVAQTPADIVPHSTPSEVAEGNELNKGAEAYRGARYDEAVIHFQKASGLAPDEPIAKLYLGTALSQKVVPGLETPENLKIAEQAIDNFEWFLKKRPHDVNPMKQIAAVYFSINRLEEAKAWQKKVLVEDPKDPEAAYTIGVIDWQETHQNVLKVLAQVGLNDDGEGNAKVPARLMERIKAQNGELVEEGLQYLNQAVKNRPNYYDAMAYLNLMYRRKADLDWGNEKARKDDVAKAIEWMKKAFETRKSNEEKRLAEPDSAKP